MVNCLSAIVVYGDLWLPVCETGVLCISFGQLSPRHITVSLYIDKCQTDRVLHTSIGL